MRYDDPSRPRTAEGTPLQTSGAPLPVVTLIGPAEAGGWLACVHAARGGNRFGYHTAVLADLEGFSREWLEDPEACLARHFKYLGPEEASRAPVRSPAPIIADLWED